MHEKHVTGNMCLKRLKVCQQSFLLNLKAVMESYNHLRIVFTNNKKNVI